MNHVEPIRPAHETEVVEETRASTGLRRPVPLVTDIEADPLEGIPPQLFDLIGVYDNDTPGGCG